MVFMAMSESMCYHFIKKETQKKMSKNQKTVFENLMVGANVSSIEEYQRVAEGIIKISEERIKIITINEIIKEFLGGYNFIDTSGYLM